MTVQQPAPEDHPRQDRRMPGAHPSGPLPTQQPPGDNGLVVGGFVCALVGFVIAAFPVIGGLSWVLAPVGLGLSIWGLTRIPQGGGKKLAIWGIVLASLAFIVCLSQASRPSTSSSSTSSSAGTTQPAYSAPTYSAPTYSAPSYSSPSYAVPSYEAPAAPAVPDGSFTEGTYEVGTGAGQVAPGKYRTPGVDPGSIVKLCAAFTQKADGTPNDMRTSSGGPVIVTIKPSDAQVQFSGDCTWSTAG